MTTSEIMLCPNQTQFYLNKCRTDSMPVAEAVSMLVSTRQSHLGDPRNAVHSWDFALGTHRIFLTN